MSGAERVIATQTALFLSCQRTLYHLLASLDLMFPSTTRSAPHAVGRTHHRREQYTHPVRMAVEPRRRRR
jgi:hypothetical protein